MTGQQLEKLLKNHLLPHLPKYAVKKRLVYRRPVDLFLRGFYFDASSMKSAARIYVFGIPLYVPNVILHFTHGDMLRHPEMGTFYELANEPERVLNDKIAPFVKGNQGLLRRFANLERFQAYLNRAVFPFHEEHIYTSIFLDNLDDAWDILDSYKQSVRKHEAEFGVNEDTRLSFQLASKNLSLAKRDLAKAQSKLHTYVEEAKERFGLH